MTALCTSGSIASCSGELWGYVYSADDQRVLAMKSDATKETWTIRDFGNRILRRDEWASGPGTIIGSGLSTACSGTIAIYCQSFESGDYLGWSQIDPGDPSQATDYVWRGDKLFASQSSSGDIQHFALDHLGTIRLATNDLGEVAAQHAYFPFGEEASSTSQDAEPMKFTGHERDLQTTASSADDLDQMNARFRSPLNFRFLSVDTVGGSPSTPQTWNRYSYVLGNPLAFADPTGESAEAATLTVLTFPSLGEALAATVTVSSGAALGTAILAGGAIGYGVSQLPGVSESVAIPALSDAISNLIYSEDQASDGQKKTSDDPSAPKEGASGGDGAHKKFSEKVRQQTLAENSKCVFCKTETTKEKGSNQANIDHAQSRAKGGNNRPENAQTTCRQCNQEKRTMSTKEYLQARSTRSKKPPTR